MTSADLENHLERYLELRRALGFERQIEGRLLRDFLAFLQRAHAGRTNDGPGGSRVGVFMRRAKMAVEPFKHGALLSGTPSRSSARCPSPRLRHHSMWRPPHALHLLCGTDRSPYEGRQRTRTGRFFASAHLGHINRSARKLRSPPSRSGPLTRCRCGTGGHSSTRGDPGNEVPQVSSGPGRFQHRRRLRQVCVYSQGPGL